MALIIKQQHLADDQYLHDEFPKSLLVLHFTAGFSAAGALASWAASLEHVATAYLVEKDGTIVEAFPPALWAYHLGENSANDKRSVAIEIVNIGPLKRAGDTLCCWPDNYSRPYCKLSEIDKYVDTVNLWRGFRYFASFPEPQIAAVTELVSKICTDFSIPKAVSLPNLTVKNTVFYKTFTGISSHQNFRSDKTDVGPAFPWDRILA